MERTDFLHPRLLDKLLQNIGDCFLALLLVLLHLLLVLLFPTSLTCCFAGKCGCLRSFTLLLVSVEDFIVTGDLRLALLNLLLLAQQADVAGSLLNLKVLLKVIEHGQTARPKHLVHLETALKHHLLLGFLDLFRHVLII